MNNEIRWFARLGLDRGLFARDHCRAVRAALGDSASLLDFAQKIHDDGCCTKVDDLETIAASAIMQAKGGQPPTDDPFAEPASAPDPDRGSITEPSVPLFDFADITHVAALETRARLMALLKECTKIGASDLHLSAGARPFIRHHCAHRFLSDRVLTADESSRLNLALLTEEQRTKFLEEHDFDCALSLDPAHRYRVNLMVHHQGPAGCYRMVPPQVRPLAELGFRNVKTIKKLLTYHNGLILVTGPAGAGKTTTLASLVALLNDQREDHIITVEDPIEVVQEARGCNVTQREVGRHTCSFASALKSALREDPDIIVIGELRDLETIEMAVTAAETGHLVIGTMHTSDAATTLNRLLDVFPPSQQSQIRATVAETLRGIICQKLLPATGDGVVLASEILVSNPAVGNLIRENKPQGLRNVMETGVKEGMCLMENAVFDLYREGKISRPTALAHITNRVLRARI